MELEFAASHLSTLQVFITKRDQEVQTPVLVPAPLVLIKESSPEQLAQEVPVLPLPSPPVPVRGDRLATRLAFVQKKLESPSLPAHRRAKLLIKKSKLEEAMLRTPVAEVPAVPQQQGELVEQTNKKCRGRKDPNDRLLAIEKALSNPNLPPKRIERLKQQKAKLEALNSEIAPAPVVVASPAPEAVVPLRGPAARLAAIEKILAQPDLNPRRLQKLQEKKAKLEALKSEIALAPVIVASLPFPVPSQRCRGPEARLAAISKMIESPGLPPRRLQKLINQKSKIEERIKERAQDSQNCRRGKREQETADVGCRRGRCRDQDFGFHQKPKGARIHVVKRK